jgi:hypothetical protein
MYEKIITSQKKIDSYVSFINKIATNRRGGEVDGGR